MDAWPFTEEDWEAVEEAIVALVNASGEEADEVIAAKLKNVFDILKWQNKDSSAISFHLNCIINIGSTVLQ